MLPRAGYEPPASLQKQIWPWLEGWLARVQARVQGKGWKAGGLAQVDKAAENFLKLLGVLRSVLLQDLAVLQPILLPLTYPSSSSQCFSTLTGSRLQALYSLQTPAWLSSSSRLRCYSRSCHKYLQQYTTAAMPCSSKELGSTQLLRQR